MQYNLSSLSQTWSKLTHSNCTTSFDPSSCRNNPSLWLAKIIDPSLIIDDDLLEEVWVVSPIFRCVKLVGLGGFGVDIIGLDT